MGVEILRVFLCVCAALLSPLTASAQVEIAHRWGTTRIDGTPQRIVSLSYNGADSWLALGVQPVAYRVWYGGDDSGLWPWAAPLATGGTPLRGEIDMEAIVRLQPDLIEAMYSGLTEAQYRTLSRFAPVLPPQAGVADFGHDWRSMIEVFGRASGREARAIKVIAGLDARLAEVARPDWQGRTAAMAMPDGPMLLFARDPRMRLLSRLGFEVPQAARRIDRGSFYAELDPEVTAPLDADLLIWLDLGGGVGAVRDHPLRGALRAAAEGRELVAPPEISAALSYGSALSLGHALDWLAQEIPPALDGDPATPVPSARAAGLAP